MTIHIERDVRNHNSFSVEVYYGGEQWGNSGLTAEEALGAVAAVIYAGHHPFLEKPLARVQALCKYSDIREIFGDPQMKGAF